MSYLEKFGTTLPTSMLNSDVFGCSRCNEAIRFTISYVKRVGQAKILCRLCYKKVYGAPRPILGREKVHRINVRKAKPVQPQKKEKKGKRKGGQEATD